MANSSSQPTHVPASSDASPSPTQPTVNAAHTLEGQHTISKAATPPTQLPTAVSGAAQLNTPLAGSLNSKPPLFYIRASAAQLKAIVQSAPEEVRSRIRSNASKEDMLDEVFKLRHQEALVANDPSQQVIEPHDALHKLLTMEPRDVATAVDTSPENVRKLMEAALQADNTLNPRVVPEDRHSIVYTVLSWQVNAYKGANPPRPTTGNQQPAQSVPTLHHQTARILTSVSHGVINNDTAVNAPRQAPIPDEKPPTTPQDILALASPATPPRRAPKTRVPQAIDESNEEHKVRRKRVRDSNTMEHWIQGFHAGTEEALEQTLLSYPENRPGANRLNVNTFRGPQILGMVINRNMGLQQYVASLPFWKKSVNGRPTQSHMEAHNIARMLHLEILAHSSPLEALRHRPSLEIGLRRLYAMMYVEKQIATGEMRDRGAAWQNIEFLLESTPLDIYTCKDIEEEL